jgi:hypothetical protein
MRPFPSTLAWFLALIAWPLTAADSKECQLCFNPKLLVREWGYYFPRLEINLTSPLAPIQKNPTPEPELKHFDKDTVATLTIKSFLKTQSLPKDLSAKLKACKISEFARGHNTCHFFAGPPWSYSDITVFACR